MRSLLSDRSLEESSPAPNPPLEDEKALGDALRSETAELSATQASILQAQRELSQAMAETVRARADLDRAEKGGAASPQHGALPGRGSTCQ